MMNVKCKNCSELNYHSSKCKCGQWVLKPFTDIKVLLEELKNYQSFEDNEYNFEFLNRTIEFLEEN